MSSGPDVTAVQDGTVSQSDQSNFEYMTIQDVETGQPNHYHAILVSSEYAIHVARQMEKDLKSEIPNLKICIPDRDLLPGTSTHCTTAELMAKRCGKFIFLLSPEFPESPRCDFLLKFAHALSPGYRMKKIIPVFTETLASGIPAELYPISPINLARPGLYEWSWSRLCAAIRCPLPQRKPDLKLQEELNQIRF